MPLKLQTPKDLNKKLTSIYTQAQHIKAYVLEEDFNIEIKFKRLSEKEIEQNFEEIRDWIESLKQSSFDVDFQKITYRSLGEQFVPKVLVFTRESFLKHLGKENIFKRHIQLIDKSIEEFPKLKRLFIEKPKLIMEYDEVWERLLLVSAYFIAHPKPNVYMRELEIEGVDTKFIESHKKVLDMILSTLLEREMTKLAQHGFEKCYGLKYDLPSIRFRILDESYYLAGLSDISLPLDEFMKLDSACEKVFVTENKINGLSFPNIKSAMVIFGLGYGIESLKDVVWLREKKLYYWGDIDTHGFAILSQFRSYFPQTHSIFMDKQTIAENKNMATQESILKRFTGKLDFLNLDEQKIFNDLKENKYADRFRVEQERITLKKNRLCWEKERIQ
ncbi:MAG: DUF2220 family protein [Sulfurovum sp.]|nr:DUF2220 family protein [Sulfurovum sp.]